MEFRVPQYIDVEDKVFGPFSILQFVFLAGGAGIIFLLWRILPHIIAILLIIPVGVLTWALVFYPKQRYGRPFVAIMESAFRHYTKPRLYTWKKEEKKVERGRDLTQTRPSTPPSFAVPVASENKLVGISSDIEVVDKNSVLDEE